jgi:hypothetical protein
LKLKTISPPTVASAFSLSLTSLRSRACVLWQGKEREEDGAGESHREEGVAVMEVEVDLGDLYGAAAGWVEARTSCPHLGTMPPTGAAELARVPPPDSPCSRFGSPPSCSNSLRILWNPHSSIFVDNGEMIVLTSRGTVFFFYLLTTRRLLIQDLSIVSLVGQNVLVHRLQQSVAE